MTENKLPPKPPDAKLPAQGGQLADLFARISERLAADGLPEEDAEALRQTIAEQRDRDARVDRSAYSERERRVRELQADRARALAEIAGDATRSVEQLDRGHGQNGQNPAASASRSRQVRRHDEREQAKIAARPAAPPDARRRAIAPRVARARRAGVRPLSQARRENHARRVADAVSRGAIGWCPEQVAIEVQGTHRAIELDHTGARARKALESLPRRLSAYRKSVERIALGLDTHTVRDGNLVAIIPRPDDLSDIRSRRIVAYAYSIYLLSRTTTRRGFSRVVKGYSRGALASLSINMDTGRPCSVEYVFATSHDAARRLVKHEHGEMIPITPCALRKLPADAVVTGRDDCGPMVALDRGDALLFNQPPAHDSEPAYLGIPKPRIVEGVLVMVRNAINVYWLRKAPRPPS